MHYSTTIAKELVVLATGGNWRTLKDQYRLSSHDRFHGSQFVVNDPHLLFSECYFCILTSANFI